MKSLKTDNININIVNIVDNTYIEHHKDKKPSENLVIAWTKKKQENWKIMLIIGETLLPNYIILTFVF